MVSGQKDCADISVPKNDYPTDGRYMKIYDISQEIFTSAVYPGDRSPALTREMRMEKGDLYNLSSFEMGAHNGTHIDAPFHFLADGDTVEKIPLDKTVGYCYVTAQSGKVGEAEAREMLQTSAAAGKDKDASKRLLIKGRGILTVSAARVLAEAGICLVGVESQTVGPEHAPMEVHQILLRAGVVLLEGIRLSEVGEGMYWLNAAPLALGGADGAPCRAILMETGGTCS